MLESRSSACFFLIVVLAFSLIVNRSSVFLIVNHSLDFLYSISSGHVLLKNVSMHSVKVETSLVLAVTPGPSELKNNFRLIFHCMTLFCCPLFWAWNVYASMLCHGLPFCTFCWTCAHFPQGVWDPAHCCLSRSYKSHLDCSSSLFDTSACFVTPSLSKLSLVGLHLPVSIATALCLLAVYPSIFIVPFFTDFTVQIGCLFLLSICSIIFYSDLS